MPDSVRLWYQMKYNVRLHQNIIEQIFMNYATYVKQSQAQFGHQIKVSSVPVWIDGGGVRRVPCCCGRRVAAAGGQGRGGVGRVQRGDDRRRRRGRWCRRGGTLGRRADGVRPEES